MDPARKIWCWMHFSPTSTSSGKECKAEGVFMLLDPWWEVTGTGRFCRNGLVLQGPLFYRLRTDRGEMGHALVALFLKACTVHSHHVGMFMEWLRRGRDVGFANLLQLLDEFWEEKKEDATYCSLVAGKRMLAAASYPLVVKYLPTLLPQHFLELVQRGREPISHKHQDKPQESLSLLSSLEDMIHTDVWKLAPGLFSYGFKYSSVCVDFAYSPCDAVGFLRVYDNLKKICRGSGSTYEELSKLKDKMPDVDFWNAILFLKQQGVVVQEKQLDPWHINLDVKEVLRKAQEERAKHKAKDCYDADEGVSALDNSVGVLRHIASQPSPPFSCKNPDADREETRNGATSSESCPAEVELDPDQVQAAEMICANPVTVISGKGGCGKTTVVSLIFRAAMEMEISVRTEVENACRDFQNDTGGSQEWDVPVSVPYQGQNGKEDNEKIEILFGIYTLLEFGFCLPCQVLWSFMKAEKDEHGAPKNWKFSSVRVFVVDEGSLVSVQILNSILSMLTKFSQLQKFIILGDVRQLPSIEPGNTLSDMFNCLLQVRWAIEMKMNHRSELMVACVPCASRISDMGSCRQYRPLDFDAIMDLNAPFTIPTPDEVHPGPSQTHRLNDCQLINDLCCQHYSHHTTRNHKKKLVFQLSDKVCCTRNGYVSDRKEERDLGQLSGKEDDVEEKSEKNDKQRLCNREIFFITNVSSGLIFAIIAHCELQKECQLQHAWARTIHTFQGSEAETIVYVLGNEAGQNWRHVYTAVTRGQKRVYVVARKDGLKKAIENRDVKRKTWLGALGAVSGFRSSQCTPSPSSQCSPRVRQTSSTPCATQTPKNDNYGMEFETSHFTTTLHSDDGYAKHHENDMDVELSGYSHGNVIKNLFETEENVLGSPEDGKHLSTNDHCTTPSKRLQVRPCLLTNICI
uniref:DNA helicase B n=1 Tax=Scleropages formosus TaxID=113540 RepID=A0A8C9S6G1_SCLFO